MSTGTLVLLFLLACLGGTFVFVTSTLTRRSVNAVSAGQPWLVASRFIAALTAPVSVLVWGISAQSKTALAIALVLMVCSLFATAIIGTVAKRSLPR